MAIRPRRPWANSPSPASASSTCARIASARRSRKLPASVSRSSEPLRSNRRVPIAALELGQLLRQRRLADPQLLRRPRQGRAVRRGPERPQLAQCDLAHRPGGPPRPSGKGGRATGAVKPPRVAPANRRRRATRVTGATGYHEAGRQRLHGLAVLVERLAAQDDGAALRARARRHQLHDLALDAQDVARARRPRPDDLDATADDAAGQGRAVDQEAHRDGGRMPAAGGEAGEQRVARRRLVEVKGLGS